MNRDSSRGISGSPAVQNLAPRGARDARLHRRVDVLPSSLADVDLHDDAAHTRMCESRSVYARTDTKHTLFDTIRTIDKKFSDSVIRSPAHCRNRMNHRWPHVPNKFFGNEVWPSVGISIGNPYIENVSLGNCRRPMCSLAVDVAGTNRRFSATKNRQNPRERNFPGR
jgi:hypothetical protein